MIAAPRPWILSALSPPRFASYVRSAEGDADAALRLYMWNIQVSAAFYGPLHFLEITLRNALREQLRAYHHRSDWWKIAPLNGEGLRKVAAAEGKLLNRGAASCAPDDVVAELTFGFWVSLLGRGAAYDRTLWVPAIHKAFPHYSGKRRPLHDSFLAMLLLRNRIMHYESIHHRDLAADRQKIHRLIGHMSGEVLAEVQGLDRVPEVLALRDDVCGGLSAVCF